jgi:predicted HAD superfamily Cof-like phosphohydrolase
MKMIHDVFDFMRDSEQLVAGQFPSPHLAALYEKLVSEEYTEFMDATTDEKKLDGALDLIWVLLGYCIARNWDAVGGWKEVTRSNMSKLQVDSETGKIKRRDDGKIMKPEGWIGPDLTPFLHGEQ